ncbi:hypothetical protein [Umezawaea sp. NPDC059074]|uniref:hypothetical protein n=1 Tax=Umezawaea sp. NPDC059074 TaxID=3346716 RepID=UPI00368BCB9A
MIPFKGDGHEECRVAYRKTTAIAAQFIRKSETWERIARRRAELLAQGAWDLRVQQRIVPLLTAALEDRNRAYDLLYRGLEERWGRKKTRRFLEMLGKRETANPDGSGREMSQAWRAAFDGVIYREVDNGVEFWRPSVQGAGEAGWMMCGSQFTDLRAVRRSRGHLEKVASPDCWNCNAMGCMSCATGNRTTGECRIDCPVCCG